jgi:hypothetical protein
VLLFGLPSRRVFLAAPTTPRSPIPLVLGGDGASSGAGHRLGEAFLVEPTGEGLAAGIRTALENPEGARARAERGHALIEREYSATRHREKVAAAYAAVEGIARP